jgi:hypothetical protein
VDYLKSVEHSETMQSISQEVQKSISNVETKAFHQVRAGFAKRVAAIDFLEIHVLDRLRYLGESANLSPELVALQAQAKTLFQRFKTANKRVLGGLRRRIKSGRYNTEKLTNILARYAGPPDGSGYDTLDMIVAGLLGADAPSVERIALEPEMVHYQPTPARVILELIKLTKIGPDDIFYDLGSGLGQVVILATLLSEARATGIEFEPAYVEYARRSAKQLNIPGVEFIQADAREVSLADGTVFFMYTPFRGTMLQQVLKRLAAEAKTRPIRVCTYGPCTAKVAASSWLRPEEGCDLNEQRVAVFHSL